MQIVLISEDSDFFEYILPKLELRKSDELFRFGFDVLPDKLHVLAASVMIINSEGAEEKTLELLKLVKGTPSIIFAYNTNDEFKIQVYQNGALGFITPLTSDREFQAKMIPALAMASDIEKKNRYREMLVKSNMLVQNNEVFLDYNAILDRELERAQAAPVVLAAISPDEKTKFLLQPNQIETIILSNIRKNDILMSYATNKYFLLLFNTNIDSAKKLWDKICTMIPQKIYAGFASTTGKKRQQAVNEVLNRLHEAINYEKTKDKTESSTITNFKLFRQEFNKKIDRIVTPVFYQTKQKYSDKLFGMTINQNSGDGFCTLTIKGRNCSSSFKITSPGFTKINIDISSTKSSIPQKRITLEPDELEAGMLEDLLEQFINEFKKEINDDNS